MKTSTRILGATLILAATAAIAAENPAVVARQDAMKTIGMSTKVLGDMAKGETAFDAAAAQAAATAMAEQAAMVPALFEPEEDDPDSEAKPEIWANWDDFTAKAADLEAAAASAAGSITTAEDIGAAMQAIGPTCMACHRTYRE
ncbi:cytochrome c [Pseudoruegeria sp. HB172150]|uniref:c-type cytochrome n=1 Tax=Pseudoruegeria sp. HB172150 TaxID=2721164 RepID=UPI001556A6A1|nr:cytochrome c [Pseudoruegeria sp. HB172150]